jgi:cold shock protein
METGTVKFFNNQKGYGFISPDKGGNDVFVHISALERAGLSSLSEGQKVTYDIQQDPRTGKPAATIIAWAAQPGGLCILFRARLSDTVHVLSAPEQAVYLTLTSAITGLPLSIMGLSSAVSNTPTAPESS